MRKLSLAMMGIATAALMTMVSCRKPVNGLVTPGEARTVTFTATTESNDGSKTAVSDHDILWKEGDKISVNGEEMTLASGDGTTSGTFTGDISATAPYYIGYAEKVEYSSSDNTLKLGIPSTQTYNEGNVVVPMAAYTTKEGNIQFYNAVNVLKLNLNGNSTNASKLTSIELSHPSVNLNGDITVKFDGKGEPTFEAASNGTTTTTVNFSGGLQLTEETTSIYIVLPKIGDSKVSNNITVTFNCANCAYMEKTIAVTEDFNTVNHLIHNDGNVLTVNATCLKGVLSGEFTVGSDSKGEPKKIKFSQGNLQFQTTQKTWRFAENQWDMCDVTEESHETSDYDENTDKWIDLFGWGTSGQNHGAIFYQPWSTDFDNSNYYAYGSSSKNLYDDNGTADWGYNAISNGGNTTNSVWRTLTQEEWYYLLENDYEKWARGSVGSTNGLIILPDNWTLPGTCTFDSEAMDFTTNSYTEAEWHDMETAGAVFLPAAGVRGGTRVETVGSESGYWSSSYSGDDMAHCLFFNEMSVQTDNGNNRLCGLSVRLVRDVTSK